MNIRVLTDPRYKDTYLIQIPHGKIDNDQLRDWLDLQDEPVIFYPSGKYTDGLMYFYNEAFATLFALKWGAL